jgi:bacteriorhodopsin
MFLGEGAMHTAIVRTWERIGWYLIGATATLIILAALFG